MSFVTYTESERIYIRPLTLRDASEEYLSWLNHSETNTHLYTKKATMNSLKDYIRTRIGRDDVFFAGIFDKKKNKHIGNFQLEFSQSGSKKAGFGILIGNPDYRGKGIGTEATKLAVGYAFDVLGMKEVWLNVTPKNIAGRKAYEKAGFEIEKKEGKYIKMSIKKINRKMSAVIIGAGQVAGGYDEQNSPEIVTHAHGYYSHPKIELVGFFDVNLKQAEKMAKKWNTKAFRDLDVMFKTIKPEIVSVCVPDLLHFDVLKNILKYRPRIVISEKPLTESILRSKKIIELYKKASVSLSVNYRRRFDKTMETLKNDLAKGVYGKVYAGSGIYGKGILHGGSHMIDLGRYLFGEVLKSHALFSRVDYKDTDKTVGAFLKFEKCPQFYLVAGDERTYSLFEFEIFCEKGKICIVDEGRQIEIQKINRPNNPLQRGYNVLGKKRVLATGLEVSAKKMVENVISHLELGTELISSDKEAFKSEIVCHNLIEQKII